MVRMHSPRVQCCLCAVSVMSALFGMFMLSAGVCLVLNYNFLDVDTSGLPPDLHNDEGKKVVGIILICVGIAALGLSGLVSILYFTTCSGMSRPSSKETGGKDGQGQGQSRPASQESQGRQHNQGYYHSNGTTHVSATSSAGARRSGGGAAALPNSRKVGDSRGRVPGPVGKDTSSYGRSGAGSRNSTPPGSTRPYRPGKKNRHGQGRFRNSLPSHPEEAGGDCHATGGLAFPERGGHVNRGAELDDDTVLARGGLASGSSMNPSVIIKVDSSYLDDQTSPSLAFPHQGETNTDMSRDTSVTILSGNVGETRTCDGNQTVNTGDQQDGVEEEESDRMSRSTIDSSDTVEGAEESEEEAKKRLDDQMKNLIS